MSQTFKLAIANESGIRLGRMKWLRDHARRAIHEAGVRSGEMTVRLVGDDEMAAMHEQYSGKAGTTDILTFDLRDDDERIQDHVDADIVISLPVATTQAKQRGHGVEREILLYIIHGVLHCLGYDDHGQADFRRMHAREDEILEAIGVGATFHSSDQT